MVPNNSPTGHIPLQENVAGPSRGNPSLVHSGISNTGTEDVKTLASRYLHNPCSHVNDLRVRRSRSGAVKVLILLEIDEAM